MKAVLKVENDKESEELVVTKNELDLYFGEENFESQIIKFLQPPEDYNDTKRFVREGLISSVKEGGTEKTIFVNGDEKFNVSVTIK